MAKRRKSKPSPLTLQTKTLPPWLSLATFIALGILIFYPPFFRGLFFKEDMFIFHIFTAIVFTLIWVQKIYKKDYTLLKNPLDWAVLAYTVAYLLSLIGAVHPGEAYYGFLRVLNLFMVYWMVTQLVRNYEAFETIIKILLAAGTGVAVIGILAATGYSNYPSAMYGGAISSTLQYPNATAAYLAVISLLAITLIIIEKRLLTKIIYLTVTFLMILVILCALSKGAWLIFIIGALLLLIGMPGLYKISSLYVLGIACAAAGVTYTRFQPAMVAQEPALFYLLIGLLIVIIGQVIWEGFIILSQRINSRSVLAAILITASIAIAIGGAFIIKGSSFEATSVVNELSRFTNLGDSSYTSRVDFIRWGVDIIKDYPINGAGAGGWNALYHQYQDYLAFTTEAHNHFIQVGVEAGLIGLMAFIAIWIFLIKVVYTAYRREKEQDNIKGQVLMWGTFTAAIALGVHAAMDFDLSLASLALLLWILLGLISAANQFNREETAELTWLDRIHPAFNIGIAVLCILTLVISGSSSYLGYKNAVKAATAMAAMSADKSPEEQNEHYQTALKYYKKAVGLDANNAEYFTDLAYAYALRYTSLKQAEHELTGQAFQETVTIMARAEKLKAYDIKIRNSLLNTSTMLGDFKLMESQAEGAIMANPNDINAYESLAKILAAGLEYYQDNGDIEQTHKIAARLADIEELLEKQKAKKNPQRDYWYGRPLILSAETRGNIAQANYLLGEYDKSLSYYKEFAEQNPELDDTTPAIILEQYVWYAASLYMTGDKTTASSLAERIKEIDEESYEVYVGLIE